MEDEVRQPFTYPSHWKYRGSKRPRNKEWWYNYIQTRPLRQQTQDINHQKHTFKPQSRTTNAKPLHTSQEERERIRLMGKDEAKKVDHGAARGTSGERMRLWVEAGRHDAAAWPQNQLIADTSSEDRVHASPCKTSVGTETGAWIHRHRAHVRARSQTRNDLQLSNPCLAPTPIILEVRGREKREKQRKETKKAVL